MLTHKGVYLVRLDTLLVWLSINVSRLVWIVRHSLTYWSVHWSLSGEGETFWCRFVVVGLVRRGVPYWSDHRYLTGDGRELLKRSRYSRLHFLKDFRYVWTSICCRNLTGGTAEPLASAVAPAGSLIVGRSLVDGCGERGSGVDLWLVACTFAGESRLGELTGLGYLSR